MANGKIETLAIVQTSGGREALGPEMDLPLSCLPPYLNGFSRRVKALR